MNEVYYFPHIAPVDWKNTSVKTLPQQGCLALTLTQPTENKSHLRHCATALQGYLLCWARANHLPQLWRGAMAMSTTADKQGSVLQHCPPLPSEWGREMGGFQRYAVAVTARDNHLKFQSLWNAFLWLGERDVCAHFLYRELGRERIRAFLDYVCYNAVDPDLREDEGMHTTPSAPVELEDVLLDCWIKFYHQQTGTAVGEKY